MECIYSSSSISIPLSSQLTHPSRHLKPNSLSWSSSLSKLHLSVTVPPVPFSIRHKDSTVSATWSRRSRAELAKRPNRKSWKQRTDMYMRPFLLNVFFSKRFIHAKVMHRYTSKVISVASTNAKDLRLLYLLCLMIPKRMTGLRVNLGLSSTLLRRAGLFFITHSSCFCETMSAKLLVLL
ncbi:uncharacterized protein LOC111297155 [Durio zibethinus]|uniref:Uncharacterized protein LOC111297155 n=1 Tax=Durio zibethinus TaxID=66656 RepID=A0A6P5Z4M9_DURZI|nr:uncharacterized protein LOC111297155 [Durio zibethinus]